VLRRITGIDALIKVNAQATLYRPGHFLKHHDDSGYPEQHRRVAYVLYLTRDWRADWGGQLQFLDAHGNVEEVWMPRFNFAGIVPRAGAARRQLRGAIRHAAALCDHGMALRRARNDGERVSHVVKKVRRARRNAEP
jgi:hypothetical protein